MRAGLRFISLSGARYELTYGVFWVGDVSWQSGRAIVLKVDSESRATSFMLTSGVHGVKWY